MYIEFERMVLTLVAAKLLKFAIRLRALLLIVHKFVVELHEHRVVVEHTKFKSKLLIFQHESLLVEVSY